MTKQFWRDSHFRRVVDKKCALLGYYAPNSYNFLRTFRENQSWKVGAKLHLVSRSLKMGTIGFIETSVRNCQYFPSKSPEECSSKFWRVHSLPSRDFELDNLMSFYTKIIRKLKVILGKWYVVKHNCVIWGVFNDYIMKNYMFRPVLAIFRLC